jgi:hypothetical protein
MEHRRIQMKLFKKGDRVRHGITKEIGTIIELRNGSAVVKFDNQMEAYLTTIIMLEKSE